jgi:hypothetical protein
VAEAAPFQGESHLHDNEFELHNYDMAEALIPPRFPVVLLNDQPLIEGCVWRTLCFA